MDRGMRGWLFRTVLKHHWRVASWIDIDDLVQDGYYHWLRIVEKYPQATEQAHKMRLFQITFINYLNDLSKYRTRQPDVLFSDVALPDADFADDLNFIERLSPTVDEEVTLNVKAMQAPPHIRAFLKALHTEEGFCAFAKPYRRRKYSRETTNEHLCKVAKLDPRKYNLHGDLIAYFS